jgi:hypothetical protein
VADSPRETLALARTAAGAVRSLNHATLGGDGPGQAQQQIAAVHGGPAPEEGGERP